MKELEPVEWVSSVVMTKKRNRNLRTCRDLRKVKPNILSDIQSFPKSQQISYPIGKCNSFLN